MKELKCVVHFARDKNAKNYLDTSIPLDFEIILQSILGEENYDLPNEFSQEDIKIYSKHIIEVLKRLNYSIENTITTADNKLLKDIYTTIEFGIAIIKDLKNCEQIFLEAFAVVTTVSFLLVGNIPINGYDMKRYSVKNFTLNEFRTINYTQNNKQKMNLIKSVIENHTYENLSSEDIKNIQYKLKEFKFDSTKFVKWFKENYPKIYIDIF